MAKDLSDLQGGDIIDVRDIIARVEELREQRTDRWVAGWNMPGYMPDNTPEEFSDCDDARAYIEETLRERAGEAMLDDTRSNEDTDAEEAALLAAADHLKDLQEGKPDADFGSTVAGMHYFVTKDGVMGLDEDETEELATLESVLDDLKGYGGMEQWEGDWYPLTLVRRGYFEDFAREEAESCGLISGSEGWPLNCIDWKQAARELEQDYSEVDFDGTEYLYRG